MRTDVVLLPRDLQPEHLSGRTVVVFDVLRATTSMITALAAGVKEIRIFGDIAAAASARKPFNDLALLCGEVDALPPSGFDLGNSPPAFVSPVCEGRTMFVSTTNGTRAILASRGAEAVFIGALINASAVAAAVVQTGLNVTLLCAGTHGNIAMEDLLGCGAVLEAMSRFHPVIDESDTALIARRVFAASRNDLPRVLRETRGGQNVIGAGLESDIDFVARLDSVSMVGRVVGDPPVVVAMGGRV